MKLWLGYGGDSLVLRGDASTWDLSHVTLAEAMAADPLLQVHRVLNDNAEQKPLPIRVSIWPLELTNTGLTS